MPGVPSSPSDGPRASDDDERHRRDGRDAPGDVDEDTAHDGPDDVDEDDDHDLPEDADEGDEPDDGPDAEDPSTGLPRRLWTSVLLAAVLTWIALGLVLSLLEAAGAPVPPAVSNARSTVPWAPQDVWSVVADAGWLAVVAIVGGWFLRGALRHRGVRPLPASPDLAVIVAIAVVVAMVAWQRAFPDLSARACAGGAVLLTILLLRCREVWIGRDLVGPWGPGRTITAGVVLLALVAPYAAWHPLSVQHVEVDANGRASVSGGNRTDDGTGDQRTWTDGDAVHVDARPQRTVTLRFTVTAASGGVRLLDATPVVPDGGFRVLPLRPPRDGAWIDGSPLPRRLAHRDVSTREFRVRSLGRCDGREQRIDRLRVRYERLGSTVTTELATDAPVTLSCSDEY